MTEYQRSRILSESPQHGPVLLGELDKAEARIAEFDKSIRAELHDPNGTIWEVANELQAKVTKAEAELAAMKIQADKDTKGGGLQAILYMAEAERADNAEKERDLALAQLGEAREVVEHCKYAMIDPDGPLYGVDSKLIDEVELFLSRTPANEPKEKI